MQGDQVDDGADVPTTAPGGAVDTAEVERLLDQLQQESQERRARLQALAAQLPEATSRRALIRSMVASIVHAPNRPLVAKRTVLKLARTPSDLIRRRRSN